MSSSEPICTWREAARLAAPDLLGSGDELSVSTVVTYATNWGIGTPVSRQKAKYSDTDLVNLRRLLDWWRLISASSNLGASSKDNTRSLVRALSEACRTNSPVSFIAIFCPSYRVGAGAIGFNPAIGLRTTRVIGGLINFLGAALSANLGVTAKVYFSDLLLENYAALQGTEYRRDLDLNYLTFNAMFGPASGDHIAVSRLSELPELVARIGERGIQNQARRDPGVFRRVEARNDAFYSSQLGWTRDEVVERTRVLYDSYAILGSVLLDPPPPRVLYWTESAQERAELYFTGCLNGRPAVLFPNQ